MLISELLPHCPADQWVLNHTPEEQSCEGKYELEVAQNLHGHSGIDVLTIAGNLVDIGLSFLQDDFSFVGDQHDQIQDD